MEDHPVVDDDPTKDLAIPADSMRFMAERANSQTIEIDASHAVASPSPERWPT